jgi:hypothetical protein
MPHASFWRLVYPGVALLLALATAARSAEPTRTQTIGLVRHGEKPEAGLGQLDCQGLNRSLALPAGIRKTFGKPDFLFAPDPGETKTEGASKPYNYIRPLATIEPTAIAFAMPVDTSFGVSRIDDLRAKLEAPAYWNAFSLVAWEHVELVKLAQKLVADAGGDPSTVPQWKGSDFDGIYVLRITRIGGSPAVTFERLLEGLDGQPQTCPSPGR